MMKPITATTNMPTWFISEAQDELVGQMGLVVLRATVITSGKVWQAGAANAMVTTDGKADVGQTGQTGQTGQEVGVSG